MSWSVLRQVNYPVFFVFVWLVTAVFCSLALSTIIGPSWRDTIHTLLLLASYGFIYLIPTFFVCRLLTRWPIIRIIVTIIVLLLTQIFIYADGRLHDLYGFHFNGFVWNLLTTPGGFASLGADQTSPLLIAKYLLWLFAGLAICLLAARVLAARVIRWRYIVMGFLLLTLSERLLYGFAQASLYGPILNQADKMIFYQPLTMNSLLVKLGCTVKKADRSVSIAQQSQQSVRYPLAEITVDRLENPINIVFLVAESMRAEDIYNERVMPNTLRFAKRHGTDFNQHYSGGNGTRQGMFAMFYGLYGSYWDSFLRSGKTPVLFDVLNNYGYEYFLYTGAHFTYPEFDRTVFGAVPQEKLIETSTGEPWRRDEENVSMLLNDLEGRDKNKPFMGFVFFESTHARYSFPESTALEKNYLEKLDYAGLSREELSPMIDAMKARYINASHYVDSQFERVYQYLVENDLLANTIVIVTGDHGEEFMEKSRWGHNSSFVEEQVRVPLVISFPQRTPGTINSMTSHLDISTTLLQALGVTNPVDDYSLGQNIFSDNKRQRVVVASWSDLGLITAQGKLVIPFKGTTQHEYLATSKHDVPVDLFTLTQSLSVQIAEVVSNSRRFINRAP